jgi:hypothetical protein
MLTEVQKREIRKRMRAVKDATDNNRDSYIVNERIKELTDYLQSEGLLNLLNE